MALDNRRRIFHGDEARLFLMNHDPDRGYLENDAVEVESGWHFEDSDAGDGESIGQIDVHLTESETLTLASLKNYAAVVLFIPKWDEAKVLKIVTRKEPIQTTKRIWHYATTPTSETFNLP